MEHPERIAVLIPCYNEAATIGTVIDDFRAQLPDARIVVFDNRSTDESAEIAREHGADLVRVPRQGKGYVVEAMLSSVDADYYVMVDGDDTYPADKVGELLAPVRASEADMVVGARLAQYEGGSFRPLHLAGNTLIRWLINTFYGVRLTDILSGYRAFNRRVAERLPIVASGFEVETEMTIQMAYYRMTLAEVQVPYRGRPAGSASKLRTFRDGFRVLWRIFLLFRACKPLTFFGGIGLVMLALGLAAGWPAVKDYIDDRYVTHVPLAILATGLVIISAGTIFLGILLHALNWRLIELHNVLARRGSRRRTE